MPRYTVIKPWTVTYPDPIELHAGQLVLIDHSRIEENPEWQGWVWCRSRDSEGWVPQQILEVITVNGQTSSARAREGYSARELAVKTGEAVAGDRTINGWLWCYKEGCGDDGWVPLENLSPMK